MPEPNDEVAKDLLKDIDQAGFTFKSENPNVPPVMFSTNQTKTNTPEISLAANEGNSLTSSLEQGTIESSLDANNAKKGEKEEDDLNVKKKDKPPPKPKLNDLEVMPKEGELTLKKAVQLTNQNLDKMFNPIDGNVRKTIDYNRNLRGKLLDKIKGSFELTPGAKQLVGAFKNLFQPRPEPQSRKNKDEDTIEQNPAQAKPASREEDDFKSDNLSSLFRKFTDLSREMDSLSQSAGDLDVATVSASSSKLAQSSPTFAFEQRKQAYAVDSPNILQTNQDIPTLEVMPDAANPEAKRKTPRMR